MHSAAYICGQQGPVAALMAAFGAAVAKGGHIAYLGLGFPSDPRVPLWTSAGVFGFVDASEQTPTFGLDPQTVCSQVA